MVHNPPAFPQSEWSFEGGDGREGMSLRDYFAGQALPRTLSTEYRDGFGGLIDGLAHEAAAAVAAYRIADAMMAERARRSS